MATTAQAAQKWTISCIPAAYLSPCTSKVLTIDEISSTSSFVNFTFALAMFSIRYFSFLVPGIGMMMSD